MLVRKLIIGVIPIVVASQMLGCGVKEVVPKVEAPKVVAVAPKVAVTSTSTPLDPNKVLPCELTLGQVKQKLDIAKIKYAGMSSDKDLNGLLEKLAKDYGTTLADINRVKETPLPSVGNVPSSLQTSFTRKDTNGDMTYSLKRKFTFKNTDSVKGDIIANIYLCYNSATAIQKPLTQTITADHQAMITFSNDVFGNEMATVKAVGIPPGESLTVITLFSAQTNSYALTINNNVVTGDTKGVPSEYLDPAKFIESDSQLIKDEASILKKSSSNTGDLAKKTHEFVYTSMTYDKTLKSPYDYKGALSAITHHIGVCGDFADLEVALLRANGIPARAVSGYGANITEGMHELQPNTDFGADWYNTDNQGHAWVEIYLDPYGWVPADPTYAQTDASYKNIGAMLEGQHFLQQISTSTEFTSKSYKASFESKVAGDCFSGGINF